MVDKIYTFMHYLDSQFCDTTIVVATSFEEAINIYKEKRIDDKLVQWAYGYGTFRDPEYDDEEEEEEDPCDEYNRYKKKWDLTTDTFDEGTTKDLLNYRIYKLSYSSSINIIEFPMSEYNLIGVYGFHETLYDRIKLLDYANKELEEIIRKSQPNVKRARETKSALEYKNDKITELITERHKIKIEMFYLDFNSEEYKASKKRFMELKKEIEDLVDSYDEILLSYKENIEKN